MYFLQEFHTCSFLYLFVFFLCSARIVIFFCILFLLRAQRLNFLFCFLLRAPEVASVICFGVFFVCSARPRSPARIFARNWYFLLCRQALVLFVDMRNAMLSCQSNAIYVQGS